MPMQDAMMLVAHNYDTYKVENREKEREEIARKAAKMADDVLLREPDRESHPISVLTTITLLSENRYLIQQIEKVSANHFKSRTNTSSTFCFVDLVGLWLQKNWILCRHIWKTKGPVCCEVLQTLWQVRANACFIVFNKCKFCNLFKLCCFNSIQFFFYAFPSLPSSHSYGPCSNSCSRTCWHSTHSCCTARSIPFVPCFPPPHAVQPSQPVGYLKCPS